MLVAYSFINSLNNFDPLFLINERYNETFSFYANYVRRAGIVWRPKKRVNEPRERMRKRPPRGPTAIHSTRPKSLARQSSLALDYAQILLITNSKHLGVGARSFHY